MPLVFLTIGAVLIVVAVRGTHANLGQLLTQDFTGAGGTSADKGFLVWLAAIAAIGALALIPEMKTPAKLLLALVVLGILISNQGVFAQAKAALSSGIPAVTVQTAQASPTEQPLPAAFPVQVSGTTGGSSAASATSGALGLVSGVTKLFGG